MTFGERELLRMVVRDPSDVAMARKHARSVAADEGMAEPAVEALATAISEVARNIVEHASEGELIFAVLEHDGRRAVSVIARDDGPGIADTMQAMVDGYSTGKSLGLGLSGAARLVDEFELDSELGRGTTVTMRKWIERSVRHP